MVSWSGSRSGWSAGWRSGCEVEYRMEGGGNVEDGGQGGVQGGGPTGDWRAGCRVKPLLDGGWRAETWVGGTVI